LALLAVLAAAGPRGVPREKLLALFWPESDSERARHALDQTLYQLKRDLGGDILAGREELSLDPTAITSDVAEFRAALARGDRAAAAELYAGAFLDGVFISGSPDFERWLDVERASLLRDAEQALEGLASEAGSRGDHAAAVKWWQRLAALDPRKTRAVLGLMSALAEGGDRSGALRHAEMYKALLDDAEPNPEVERVADQIRRWKDRKEEPEEREGGTPGAGAPDSQPAPTAAPLPVLEAAPSSSPNAAFAGRYAIEREIGRGGSATVYLARDLRNERRVALKVLRREAAVGVAVERFRSEITITANLHHPHILAIHDSGEVDGTLYFVMPFVEGESLRDRLDREGALPHAEGVRLATEIADALAYAHARGIVHRDIKPENILISGSHALVADFGLARALQGNLAARRHTAPGMIAGTPAYLSPEQVSGGEADTRSDQYGLAYLLFEMLAGAPPFSAPTQRDLMLLRLMGPAPSLRSRRPDVPEHIDAVVARALSRIPTERFDSVSAFAAALIVEPRAGERTPAEAVAAIGRVARRRPVIAAGVALALVLAISAGVSMRTGASVERRAWIVLADFENGTGDSIFDRALDAALFAGLQQSDYVTVYPRARIQGALARMGKTPAEVARLRLDEPLAREVARREGVTAVVAGAIHGVDSSYIVSVRLVDAATGVALESDSRMAARRADVIGALDDLVRRLRREIGESAAAIARHDVPLPQATTASLEALRAYADGLAAQRSGQRGVAHEFFRRAAALDSTFALAHAELGAAYYLTNDRPSGDVHFARALALLDRLTDREQLQIRAAVASWRENREEAVRLRRAILTEYPDDPEAWGAIGYDLMRLDRPSEAIDAFERQFARDSMDPADHINVAIAYKDVGRIAEALASYRRAFALQPTYFTINNLNHEYGRLLVASGHVAEARAVHDTMLRASPGQRASGERSLAFISMYEGRYDSAIVHLERAVLLTQGPNNLSLARNRLLLAGAFRAKGGRWRDSARAESRAAHAIFRAIYIEPAFLTYLGKALLEDGEPALAAEVLDTLRKRAQPRNRTDLASLLHLTGEVALAKGLADSAVRVFRLGQSTKASSYIKEALARGLAAGGDPAGAATLYAELATDTWEWYGWEGQEGGLLAPLRLGGVYERLGDTTRAVAAYERLIGQWVAGDSDLVALGEARARVAALRGR
jgi:serine/threonine-protein kinase